MENGKVKFYNKEKKYGFIAGDSGKDYFFHSTGISPDIYVTDGDKVEFNVIEGDKGPKATDISPIDWVIIIDINESNPTFVGFFVYVASYTL